MIFERPLVIVCGCIYYLLYTTTVFGFSLAPVFPRVIPGLVRLGRLSPKENVQGLSQQVYMKDGCPSSHQTYCALLDCQDRKVIMKTMKSFVVKIAKEEFGHLVLLAVFDVVDDTKFVQKVILDVRPTCSFD